MMRLREASGGLVLPAFLAHRLATVADPQQMSYVDVVVSDATRGRADVKLLALSKDLIMVASALQVVLGRGPDEGDATTEVRVRSLRDVVEVRVGGQDTDWMSGPFADEVRVRAQSVKICLTDGAELLLPQDWRAESNARAAVELLVDSLRRS